MTIRELETSVWECERIRIVVRSSSTTGACPYQYKNAAPDNWRLSKFLENRVRPTLGSNEEVIVLRGDGTPAPGHQCLRNVRESYT